MAARFLCKALCGCAYRPVPVLIEELRAGSVRSFLYASLSFCRCFASRSISCSISCFVRCDGNAKNAKEETCAAAGLAFLAGPAKDGPAEGGKTTPGQPVCPGSDFCKRMRTMSLLEVTGLTHSFGEHLLYRDASVCLYKGEHMGLVGQNGSGKSTLIKTLIGSLTPDAGDIRWQPGIRVGHLDQYASLDPTLSVMDCLRSAFAPLYQAQERYEALLSGLNGEEEHDAPLLQEAADCQQLLESGDFYSLDARIHKVGYGLGLDALGFGTPLQNLSGGQRAKVILAKLLLEEPQVLLLDEPTNFLDKAHIDWLAKFLAGFRGAFVVVSHDFTFLNRVTTCICEIEAYTFHKYTGSYEAYARQKGQRQEEYRRQYAAQQELIRKTEDYIQRNRARASTANMAKSRQKKLDKIKRLEKPIESPPPHFVFPAAGARPGQELLQTQGLVIGYKRPLLPPLDLLLKAGQRLAVTGFNGIGKSTLLKTLAGLLAPLSGAVERAPGLRLGYYEQDPRWPDKDATPLQMIKEGFRLNDREARRALARCGLTARQAIQPVGTLSGGEQAKVKLCQLTLAPHDLLLLDEPTNHLDNAAKQALLMALQDYPGAVVLVSHDAAFYRPWANRVLSIEALLRTGHGFGREEG